MSKKTRQIMLVEPEPLLAEVTAFRLELHGYRVEIVRSAEEALQKVGSLQPDLILTDFQLPGMDGPGLIEQLALDESTSEIPVIVLSVDADLDCVQSVFNVGAKDFVVVPYHPEILEQKVAKHLAMPRGTKASGGQATAGPVQVARASKG
jgi:CheY-like chemotaxis protein